MQEAMERLKLMVLVALFSATFLAHFDSVAGQYICNNICSYSSDSCCPGLTCVLSWFNVWSIPIFRCAAKPPPKCFKLAVSPQTCGLQADPGLCKAYVPNFYYDINTKKCTQFIYGGCGGNQNRYETKEDCDCACSNFQGPAKYSSTCQLQPEKGPCDALIPRWYYDVQKRDCLEFPYGGCNNNANNFNNIQDCQQSCKVKSPPGCNYFNCGGIAGFSCCNGYDCFLSATYPDALGSCVPKKKCSIKGGKCGGFIANPPVCCDGFTCELNPQIPDLPGSCIENKCSGQGQICGGFTTPENQKSCCPGLECGPIEDIARDIPGTCGKPTPRPCDTKKCGGYVGYQCCDGYRCVIHTKNGTISDALGDCVPKDLKCAWNSEKCSGKVANPVNCCNGFYCQSYSEKTDEPGVCIPLVTTQCMGFSQSCDNKPNGRRCCSPNTCGPQSQLNAGKSGICT